MPAGSGGSSSGGGGGAGSIGSQGIIIGSSSASCLNECKEGDEQRYCSENKTITKICGNYDTDNCLEYLTTEDYCNENEKCERGMCIKTEEDKAWVVSSISNYAGKTAEIIKNYKKQISLSLALITLALVIIVSVIYLINKRKKKKENILLALQKNY